MTDNGRRTTTTTTDDGQQTTTHFKSFFIGSVTANVSCYVVFEKWHNFWELPQTNLLGLFEVEGKSTIFPKLHTN